MSGIEVLLGEDPTLGPLPAAARPSPPTLWRIPCPRLPRKRSGNIDLKSYSPQNQGHLLLHKHVGET
jgi:hypothetical protein